MRVTTQIVPLDSAVAHAESGGSGPR